MFQRETTGGAVIMGRRTWESLPFKPLKNRLNVVVSRNTDLTENVVSSVADALEMCREAGYHRVYGIGGETIYRDLLAYADRLLLTEVDLTIDDADAYFPAFDETEWHEISSAEVRPADPRCTLRELVRKR